jgi:hypothetical protein
LSHYECHPELGIDLRLLTETMVSRSYQSMVDTIVQLFLLRSSGVIASRIRTEGALGRLLQKVEDTHEYR